MNVMDLMRLVNQASTAPEKALRKLLVTLEKEGHKQGVEPREFWKKVRSIADGRLSELNTITVEAEEVIG